MWTLALTWLRYLDFGLDVDEFGTITGFLMYFRTLALCGHMIQPGSLKSAWTPKAV